MTRLVAVAFVFASVVAAAQQPLFRTEAAGVAVNVAVKRGNTPVGGLTASDFALFDDDVQQKIDVVTIESLPLDVTLFMDTSQSTAGAIGQMKGDIARISALLRPDDRFRLITIGLSVETPMPWGPPSRTLPPSIVAVPNISLVYDALAVALLHQPEPGRRHLIVALTDGEDCGSVIDGARVLEMSGRSDALLQWIVVRSQGGMIQYGVPAWCTPLDAHHVDYVGQATERTGGEKHQSIFGDPAVRIVTRIVDDFRHSYVLHYEPAGVKTKGWHQVRVTVPRRPEYTVTSRTGYFH